MPSTDKDKYSPQNQFDIRGIYLYREGWTESQSFNIKEMVEEFNLFEDMDGLLSATLILIDPMNMPDSFPILGGERVRVQFKTPSYEEMLDLEFVVYKLGEKIASSDSSKALMYEMFLCTVDRYRDVNIDLSKSYKGTYSDVVTNVLNDLKSTKPLDKQDTLGVQKFVSPYWSPLKVCRWIANRCYDAEMSPFVFFERVDGYVFKSVKALYDTPAYCRYFIEPKKVERPGDAEKLFRTVEEFQPLPNVDKMQQHSKGLFGSDAYVFSLKDKTLQRATFDYKQMNASDKATRLEKFPLHDDIGVENRKKFVVVMERSDNSHLGAYYRNMVMHMIENTKVRVMVPGDSGLRAGFVIEMDVPSKVSAPGLFKERTLSGRWLITAVRHILRRDSYKCVLELGKDSYSEDLNAAIEQQGNKGA